MITCVRASASDAAAQLRTPAPAAPPATATTTATATPAPADQHTHETVTDASQTHVVEQGTQQEQEQKRLAQVEPEPEPEPVPVLEQEQEQQEQVQPEAAPEPLPEVAVPVPVPAPVAPEVLVAGMAVQAAAAALDAVHTAVHMDELAAPEAAAAATAAGSNVTDMLSVIAAGASDQWHALEQQMHSLVQAGSDGVSDAWQRSGMDEHVGAMRERMQHLSAHVGELGAHFNDRLGELTDEIGASMSVMHKGMAAQASTMQERFHEHVDDIHARISNLQYDSEEVWAMAAILLLLLALSLLYTLYYFSCAARRPRLFTQHSSAGPGALATQRPPIRIDPSVLPALQAVAHTVSPSSRFGRLVSRRYMPTPWLSFPWLSGHLQTVYTAKASPRMLATPLVTYKRELLRVEAGSPHTLAGQVALDWAVLGKARNVCPTAQVAEWEASFTETTPTVLLCHGLAGGSNEHYVKNVAFTLSQPPHGYRCVVFNARGCGGQEIVSPQLYCGAYTDDLRQVVANLHARLPRAPLIAVGFSLGANILTKFLGEEGAAGRPAPFAAAVSVANPLDFLHGARHLDSNIVQRELYSRTLAQNLIRLFKTHVSVLEGDAATTSEEERAEEAHARAEQLDPDEPLIPSTPVPSPPSPARDRWDLASVFAAPTIREFDKRLTRIVFGYATVDDYYRDASSSRFVKFINTPTLFLNAMDDPISDHVGIPYDECCINPFVTLVTTATGGHSMDHYEGLWQTKSWSARVIAAFVADVLSVHGAVGNQARATPVPTPPPQPHMEAEEEEEGIDVSSCVPVVGGSWCTMSLFSPSAPGASHALVQEGGSGDDEDVRASLAAALDMQQQLAQLEQQLAKQQQQQSQASVAMQGEDESKEEKAQEAEQGEQEQATELAEGAD